MSNAYDYQSEESDIVFIAVESVAHIQMRHYDTSMMINTVVPLLFSD